MDAVDALRVEALFCSDLQRSDTTTSAQVRDICEATVFRLRQDGIEARVAYEFGRHPESALRRMCWARAEVELAFAGQPV